MALASPPPRDARTLGFLLASLVPLGVYVATLSPFAYWHDGGEFVAASVGLGISHPPGHPLAALVGALPTLLPVGPLAFRVAFASALCAALAAGSLFLAVETTVRAVGLASARVTVPLALGAAWVVAFSYGFWFQAVRTEVYALEAALLFFALERVLRVEAAWPTTDVSPLYLGAFAVGLALTNHHFLAFLVLPAVAPTLARVHTAHGARPLAISVLAALSALVFYAYLPLRAHQGPLLNLGAPTDLGRLFWVVSAQTFQKNTGGGVPEPAVHRVADVFVQFVENLGWPVLILAVLGLYAMLRLPGVRRLGLVWALVLALFAAARAWLGFVRGNPDALGYLMPVMGALAAAAAAFLAFVITMVLRGREARPALLAYGVALLPLAFAVMHGRTAAERASLAAFADTDALDEATLRALPEDAVFFAFDPQTVFRAYDFLTVEASRPDVTLVPMPFLTYPGLADELAEREPRLKEVLRQYLLSGELGRAELESLAAERPAVLELDVRVGTDVFAALVPDGLGYRVRPLEVGAEDRALGAKTQRAAWARVRALLPETPDPETQNRMLWRHYMAALFFAHTGDRALARESVVGAMEINPKAAELLALDEALEATPGKGPIDITPFLPSPSE